MEDSTPQGVSSDGANGSSSSSTNEGAGSAFESTLYAPIRGSEQYNGSGLQRTVTEMYGHLSEEERTELRSIISIQQSRPSIVSRAQSLSNALPQSSLERKDTLAGVTCDDPRLDPTKAEFDIYIWARALVRALDDDEIKIAKAGFTFKDLSVSGSGSALSLQKNVGSVLMAPFRLGEYFSLGNKPHKQIIRNFNGVVKSGEMLVVLGRPGSGCSTFLKTICGELTGLQLEKGSTVHYNGISQEQMTKEFKGEVVYNQEVGRCCEDVYTRFHAPVYVYSLSRCWPSSLDSVQFFNPNRSHSYTF